MTNEDMRRAGPERVTVPPNPRLGWRLVWLLVPILGLPATAFAHATGEHYIFIDVHETHIDGRFEINVEDLTSQLGLALTGQSLMEEIDRTAPEVREYITAHFHIRAGSESMEFQFSTNGLVDISTGSFAQYFFTIAIETEPDVLDIEDNMLFDRNPFHRGLFLINYNHKTQTEYGKEHTALLFSPSNRRQQLDLRNIPSLLKPRDFVWQGMLHIWVGLDHVLFLLALLLPAVLVRKEKRWIPVDRFRQALLHIIKIVTAFTIAHSLTLSLAALDIITLSSRLVESVIALSIVVVALNNLHPVFDKKSWVLILGFGLFHGLGFASVMGHLPFRMGDLLKVVLAFNVGVEIGQVVIVAIAFPILYGIRKWHGYNRVVLSGGSIVVAAIAGYWFLERAFDL